MVMRSVCQLFRVSRSRIMPLRQPRCRCRELLPRCSDVSQICCTVPSSQGHNYRVLQPRLGSRRRRPDPKAMAGEVVWREAQVFYGPPRDIHKSCLR